MRNTVLIVVSFFIFSGAILSCNSSENKQTKYKKTMQDFEKGSFGYDLMFLRDKDSTLVVLQSDDSASRVIVSPKYQAKVFTSTSGVMPVRALAGLTIKLLMGQPMRT
ncbi:hypothetical protein MKP09_15235 [Niabella ginsengisoli]|uniref:Spi protease inhibitor domain-containing protein n=1 Tax=Niabella ginsengisoli TaxID=522298 RepID=A0ABS9SLE8_9BACT|nr:DUF6786 family protein [Niabella ginsengisoli]MCH5599165.1 hypothetical protein [Niabella ginsengisoli]